MKVALGQRYGLLPVTLLLQCSIQLGHAFSNCINKQQRGTAFLHGTSTGLFSAHDSNVVLRPTIDNDSAFDSLKIGGVTVHRYTRDVAESNIGEEPAEYVMWYHGRSVKQDEDKSLPPLSTGRIGRATSRNGLLWKKDTEGSASEDTDDCSLGLNKESWWGFDTAHVGLGNVLLPVSTPAVITEGGVYLMYYMGGNFEETPISDYTDADVPDDAMIKGMNMKIGVCVSQDGKTWGRVEGDDPTGACVVPYREDKKDIEAFGANLKEELYCGWPAVVVNVDRKDEEQSGFFMYYSTMTKGDKVKCIGWAESKDGFRWTKRGICLEPEPDTMDDGGCARCTVLRNAVFDDVELGTWIEAPGYTMLYEGVSKKDNKHRIMKATSNDGQTWTRCGVVLDVGESEDAWDSMGVGSPNLLRMDDGSQRMYYAGQGKDGSTAIGVAKLEIGAGKWEREQASITFAEA